MEERGDHIGELSARGQRERETEPERRPLAVDLAFSAVKRAFSASSAPLTALVNLC